MDQDSSQQQAYTRYDISQGGHYGACAALSEGGHKPSNDLYCGNWSNISKGLTGVPRDILNTYWQHTIDRLGSHSHDFENHQLPPTRIRKVMKADPEVKIVSKEALILFAKGCEIFISELTMRAWINAKSNKRRTMKRIDITIARSKSDMFDFLVDIAAQADTSEGGPTEQQQMASLQFGQQGGFPMRSGEPDAMYGQLGCDGFETTHMYSAHDRIPATVMQYWAGYAMHPNQDLA